MDDELWKALLLNVKIVDYLKKELTDGLICLITVKIVNIMQSQQVTRDHLWKNLVWYTM